MMEIEIILHLKVVRKTRYDPISGVAFTKWSSLNGSPGWWWWWW
jgi:hypothetical protein